MLMQLAVAIKDEVYLMRLSAYFRRHPIHANWTIIAFTSAEACRDYLQEGGRIDFLIADSIILQEIMDRQQHFPVAELVEQENSHSKLRAWPNIMKYQPLPHLIQKILEIYSGLTGTAQHTKLSAGTGKSGAQVIAVYSASGNIGKTAIALHLAHAAGVQHSRVFYMNLERWSCFELWLGEPLLHAQHTRDGGMSELLYSIKKGGAQSNQWLEFRKRHKLLQADYVEPFNHDEDRANLSGEEAAAMIELAASSGYYDVIVVDLDSAISNLQLAVIDRADVVVWVASGDQTILNKQLLALQYMEKQWPERHMSVIPKLEVVFNGIPLLHVKRNNYAVPIAASFVNSRNVLFPEVQAWKAPGEARLLSSASFRAAADTLLHQIMQKEQRNAAT